MAIVSRAGRKGFTEALVAAYPWGVLVDADGRAVSDSFPVTVNESGDATNAAEVTSVIASPAALRLYDDEGSSYDITLPPRWLASTTTHESPAQPEG